MIEKLTEETLEKTHETIKEAFGEEEPDNSMGFLMFSLQEEKTKVFNLLEFFILKEDDEVIGVFGIVSLGYDPKEVAWLCYAAVKKGFQNKGHGAQLLSKVVDFAKSRGIQRLFTETTYPPGGIQARAFYEKNGFKPAGEINDFFKPGEKTLYMMREL